MSYVMTNFTNATNIATQYLAVNKATDGILAALLLLTVFIIFTMTLLRVTEPAEAIAGSSTISMVFGFILAALGALDIVFAWAAVLILAFSLAALALRGR